ncbi:adenosylcobinamide-phosphate synthase CbiB [Marinobacter sp. SS21]|uniref:adenosylcobinamide-phosphate synthase CbiB n=1 Tax=Marinobacter sp. SS21 TaxID=2979460 RepID=UPI003FA5F1AB
MDWITSSVLVCVAAVVLDRCLGEPVRWHPLVGFGALANGLEQRLNRARGTSVWRGAVALAVLVVPIVVAVQAMAWWLPQPLNLLFGVLVLWSALSLRGLTEHGGAVAVPLATGNLGEARARVGWIVSRQASALDEAGVAAAATESMLENGADAVFASLFWFLLAGPAGVVAHRLINTLDAMWGYRNDRFLRFGRVAARLDDVVNWLPARLTALTYTLLGRRRLAWRCWRSQAPAWDSPNAGPVMAAGAGALGVTLGGPAPYAGGLKSRPRLGEGPAPDAATIGRAIGLIQRGVCLWLLVLAAGAAAAGVLPW